MLFSLAIHQAVTLRAGALHAISFNCLNSKNLQIQNTQNTKYKYTKYKYKLHKMWLHKNTKYKYTNTKLAIPRADTLGAGALLLLNSKDLDQELQRMPVQIQIQPF